MLKVYKLHKFWHRYIHLHNQDIEYIYHPLKFHLLSQSLANLFFFHLPQSTSNINSSIKI